VKPTSVLHLVGSPTSAFHRDLSRLYAKGCLDALTRPDRHTFLIAYVTPDSHWCFPATLSDYDIEAAAKLKAGAAIAHLANLDVDLALPQMFCPRGMTEYRAIFDLLDIPFVGNRPAQMAITANKAQTKAIAAAAGVRVPRGELIRKGGQPTLPAPSVVKPNSADNSLGVSLVRRADEYPAALASAFAHDEEVLVEEFIPLGREVRCGILDRDGGLTALPLEEYFVDPESRPVRTYDHKLARSAPTELTLTSKDPSQSWIVHRDDPIFERVAQAAKLAHRALGCRHYGLFDFRVDPDGTPWFTEAGLYCSFSPQSVLVTMMNAHGCPLTEFFDRSVEQVLSEHRNRTPEELRGTGVGR
jgi:D-alanine-D-alanine ligase